MDRRVVYIRRKIVVVYPFPTLLQMNFKEGHVSVLLLFLIKCGLKIKKRTTGYRLGQTTRLDVIKRVGLSYVYSVLN